MDWHINSTKHGMRALTDEERKHVVQLSLRKRFGGADEPDRIFEEQRQGELAQEQQQGASAIAASELLCGAKAYGSPCRSVQI